MPQIRTTSQIAQKWARVTPQRSEDYAAGVRAPRVDWAQATQAAEQTWRDAITAAAGRGAFSSGVRTAGTAKWQARTIAKGPSRFAEGVMVGAADYEAGFAPYRDVIEHTQLPPRGPKGDPRNVERVRTMAQALRVKRVGTAGGSR